MFILRIFFALKKENIDNTYAEGGSELFDVCGRTARLCERAKCTLQSIVTSWNKAFSTNSQGDESLIDNAIQAQHRGNRKNKPTIITNNPQIMYGVRDFVQQKRINRKKVTATEVLGYFIERENINIRTESSGIPDAKDYKAALRSTQRYLTRNGFQRGKRSGAVQINPKHIAWRNNYMRIILENRSKPAAQRLQEVYSDESYIHHHHRNDKDNLYHPNNEHEGKGPHKGRRFCFVAAIFGNGKQNRFGLVPGSVWIFCPNRKDDHLGDYHKVFNSYNYTEWFRHQLLPNLHEPSLIIIDNAKYHKTKPSRTRNASKLKKDQVLRELQMCGISYDENISAVEAKMLLRNCVNDNIEPEIVQMAKESGHKVIFAPPHYSDLQPIELLWARLKNSAGRQYIKSTTLEDVKQRLNRQFETLETEEGQDGL